MASNPVTWIWSAPHNDYYYYTFDSSGKPVYHFSKQITSSLQQTINDARPRRDSGDASERPDSTRMPSPVPQGVRSSIPGLIAGTPNDGWYHSLDSSYRMRTGYEAKEFFVKGRVFAMLYSEPAGSASIYNNDDAYSVVRFNEVAYSTIRRFIVIEVKRGFVYAWQVSSISSYSGRGVLKPGCDPREHAIVYFTGTYPAYIPGEFEAGMVKEPIEVVPTDPNAVMKPESRIRFGKRYPIEMNVKVKDLGRVHPDHMARLLQYCAEEFEQDYHQETYGGDYLEHGIFKSSPTPEPDLNDDDLVSLRRDVNHHLSADRMEGVNSRLVGDLHSDYEVIKNPRGFFKKGRVFLVPWPEPGGDFVKDQSGPPVLVKIRRFVVIRPKATSCLCLPISTYQGQATTKPGVAVQDHAAVVLEGGEVQYHVGEAVLWRSPMFIKVENQSTGPIDPMSRINFGKVYTVEYNVKVRNVGRIVPDSIWRMDEYFTECSRIGGT